jgi:hypothetical protein
VLATFRDDIPRALRLAGAAQGQEARSGVGLGTTATEVAGAFERMKTELPEEDTARYFAEGEAMSAEDAIAYALKEEG